jgi:hypothetical protein
MNTHFYELLGRIKLISYIYSIIKNNMNNKILIGKILWNHNDETFHGPFNSHDEWEKWAEDYMSDNSDEIDEISFHVLYNTELKIN